MAVDAKALEADGWELGNAGGFTDEVGPFWIRRQGDSISAGLQVEERHCNRHIHTIHGGVVMTFADIGLGLGVGTAIGGNHCVTASLQTHFLATARAGDFIHCTPEVVRQGKSMVFVRGLIMVGDTPIAQADGIWKVFSGGLRVPA